MAYGLKEFLRRWLNGFYYRDYRTRKAVTELLGMNTTKKLNLKVEKNSNNELYLDWLLKNMHKPSKVYYELSYFININDLINKNNKERYTDRIMFDFDVSDGFLKSIKDEIEEINKSNEYNMSEKYHRIKELQNIFQDYLFNSDVIEPAYNDTKRLCNFLQEYNIPFFTEFSGGKGFHVYVFIPPTKLEFLNNKSLMVYTVRRIGEDFKNKLKLDTLDLAPFKDILTRLGRIPYSRHESSCLTVLPCDLNYSWKEILTQAKADTYQPVYFDINNYYSYNFYNLLMKTKELVKLQFDEEIITKIDNTSYCNIINKPLGVPITSNGGVRDEPFNDMRLLCSFLIPDYFVSDNGHYHKYNCPFCGNNDASVLVTEKTFNCKHNHCTGEIMKEFNTDKLNYFLFIKKLFQLKSDNETKQKMREIKEACLKQT